MWQEWYEVEMDGKIYKARQPFHYVGEYKGKKIFKYERPRVHHLYHFESNYFYHTHADLRKIHSFLTYEELTTWVDKREKEKNAERESITK